MRMYDVKLEPRMERKKRTKTHKKRIKQTENYSLKHELSGDGKIKTKNMWYKWPGAGREGKESVQHLNICVLARRAMKGPGSTGYVLRCAWMFVR